MKRIIVTDDAGLTDEEIYCPNCGICIEYGWNGPPNYCPSCGSKIKVKFDDN